MPTPPLPYVDYLSFSFNQINSDGMVVLNCTFKAKLTDLFVYNETNNEIIVTVSIIKEDISYPIINTKMSPNQTLDVLEGKTKTLSDGDVVFVHTNFKTHYVTCSGDYAKLNELS